MDTIFFELLSSVAIVAIIIAASYAVYWIGNYFRAQEKTITASNVVTTALNIARAAEQMWLSHQINADERKSFAMAELKRIFPNLDEKSIGRTIETAVKILKEIDRATNEG